MNSNMNMNFNQNDDKKELKPKKSHKSFLIISSILIALIVLCIVTTPNKAIYRNTYEKLFGHNVLQEAIERKRQVKDKTKGSAELTNKGGSKTTKTGESTNTQTATTPIKDSNGYTIDDYRTAVNKSAYAFYHRKVYLQYSNRKMMHASPENATAGHTVYSSCTTFANQVYYDVFGITLPSDGTKLNEMAKMVYQNVEYNEYTPPTKGKYVIAYYDEGLLEHTSAYDIITDMAPYLKKGDLYNFHQKGESFSHTMIITGIEPGDPQNRVPPVVKLIESNGADYNYKTMEDNYESSNNSTIGTIRTTVMTERMDVPNLESLTFVRYITDDFTYLYYNENAKTVTKKKLSLTERGIGRLKAQDVYIEKNASALTNSNVPPSGMDGVDNSIVTFKIRIVRRSNVNYKDMHVFESIDKNATIIDAKCLENCDPIPAGYNAISSDGKSVSWTFDLNKDAAADNILLSYTIRVDGPVGGDIVSTGNVGGIKNATYVFHINRQLTPNEKGKILSRYNQEKNASNTSMTELIKKVYSSSGANLDLSYLNGFNVVSVLDNDTSYSTSVNNNASRNDARTKITNTTVAKVTLNNFYGLRICNQGHGDNGADHIKKKLIFEGVAWDQMSSDTDEFKERAREIKLDQLQVGDIIYRYTEYSGSAMKNKIYLYLGNNTYCGTTKCKGFVTIENGQLKEITGSDAGKLLRDVVYDNYIVLRPALAKA